MQSLKKPLGFSLRTMLEFTDRTEFGYINILKTFSLEGMKMMILSACF